MLPIPAITCWSSSNGLRRVDRRRSTAPQLVGARDRRRAGRGRAGRPRAARRRRARGRRRPSRRTSAGRRTARLGRSPRWSTTWVCSGRSAPGSTSSSWPVMRRWTINASPESSGIEQVLAAAPGGDEGGAGETVDQRLARRPPHRSLTPDLDALDAPADDEALQPAPDGLDLRQFRHRWQVGVASRSTVSTASSSAPASATSVRAPPPPPLLGGALRASLAGPEHRSADRHGGEEALLVVGALLGDVVQRRRPCRRAAISSCSVVLKSSSSSRSAVASTRSAISASTNS